MNGCESVYMARTYPIVCATRNGKIDAMKVLLELGAWPLSDAAFAAIRNDQLDCLKLLMTYRSYRDSHLLITACGYDNKEIINELFRHGVRLSNTLYEIRYIVGKGYVEIVRDVLERHKLDKKDLNEMMLNDVGCPEMVDILLSYGADIDAFRDYDEATPLYIAITKANIAVAKHLIDRDANVNSARILHAAIENHAYELVYTLLDRGADINAMRNRITALSIACNDPMIDIEFIRTMLDRGADPNISRYSTPIHGAVRVHRYDIASLLMDRGADVMLREDTWDKSALMLLIADRAEGRIDTNALARQLLADDSNPRHGKN